MEQAVYSFWGKKYTDSVLAIKSDLIFTSIVTTNFQRTLESSNANNILQKVTESHSKKIQPWHVAILFM